MIQANATDGSYGLRPSRVNLYSGTHRARKAACGLQLKSSLSEDTARARGSGGRNRGKEAAVAAHRQVGAAAAARERRVWEERTFVPGWTSMDAKREEYPQKQTSPPIRQPSAGPAVHAVGRPGSPVATAQYSTWTRLGGLSGGGGKGGGGCSCMRWVKKHPLTCAATSLSAKSRQNATVPSCRSSACRWHVAADFSGPQSAAMHGVCVR